MTDIITKEAQMQGFKQLTGYPKNAAPVDYFAMALDLAEARGEAKGLKELVDRLWNFKSLYSEDDTEEERKLYKYADERIDHIIKRLSTSTN